MHLMMILKKTSKTWCYVADCGRHFLLFVFNHIQPLDSNFILLKNLSLIICVILFFLFLLQNLRYADNAEEY